MAAAKWKLAPGLETLRQQVNALAPKRSKASDGTIGDAAHASRTSDHNPNARGVVNALDITHDPSQGVDIAKIATALIASRDPRIKYLIFNGKIVSGAGGTKPWSERVYKGANKHTKHVHISVKDKIGDGTGKWNVEPAFSAAPTAPAKPAPAALKVTKQVILDVQTRLSALGYNPGGIDGVQGKLTNEAILSFKSENGLPTNVTIDDALIKALASAKPRELAPERVAATPADVVAKVPEAKAHWWNKWLGGGTAVATAIVGVADATGGARGYVEPLRDLANGVPGWVWLGLITVVALSIFVLARKGEAKSVEAFQSGERR